MTSLNKAIWLVLLLVGMVLLWGCGTTSSRRPPRPHPPKLARAVPAWNTNTIYWDYENWLSVTNFKIYRGPASRTYTNGVLTGKVLTNQFRWQDGTVNYIAATALGTNGFESDYSNELRLPVPVLTNFVITVTSTNATNLQWTTAIKKTGTVWTLYGATNYAATNPAPRFWRAMGATKAKPGKVFIKGVWQ